MSSIQNSSRGVLGNWSRFAREVLRKGKKRLSQGVSASIGLCVTLCGCGGVDQAQAPHEPLVLKNEWLDSESRTVLREVQNYPLEDLDFKEAQIFLWKKGTLPSEITEVLKNVKASDQVRRQLARMRVEEYRTGIQLKKAGLNQEEFDLKMSSLRVQLRKTKAAIQSTQSAIKKLLAQGELTEEQKLQLEELRRQLAARETERDRVQTDIQVEQSRYDQIVSQETVRVQWRRLGEISTQREELQNELGRLTQPIDQRVSLYNSSPIGFKFFKGESGRIEVKISNWDLSRIEDADAAEPPVQEGEFSTQRSWGERLVAGSVRNVKYEEKGGRYTFEVVSHRAVFWFNLSRVNVSVEEEAIIRYKGDVIRCSVVEGEGWPVLLPGRDTPLCGVSDFGHSIQLGRAESRSGGVSLSQEIPLETLVR